MTQNPHPVSFPDLRLLAPCSGAGDLAPVLARGLGLSPADVRTLPGGTGVLLCGEGAQTPTIAARATGLARAFGVALAAQGPRRLRISLQAADPDTARRAAVALAELTGGTCADLTDRLLAPGGLIAEPAGEDEAEAFRRIAVGLPGMTLDQAGSPGSELDLFAPSSDALDADLRCLGLGPSTETGALAAGLDAATARWLVRRHPGVLLLDRAFQRFDLLLLGRGRLSPQELADFLVLRTGLSAVELASARPDRPVVIERRLKRAAALRFLADYRTIGMDVRLQLSGRHTA